MHEYPYPGTPFPLREGGRGVRSALAYPTLASRLNAARSTSMMRPRPVMIQPERRQPPSTLATVWRVTPTRCASSSCEMVGPARS